MVRLRLRLSCRLWSDVDWGLSRKVVDPAPFTEAVTHHALGKQKKDECHDDYKQEGSNPDRG
jgi:hypothetical protein